MSIHSLNEQHTHTHTLTLTLTLTHSLTHTPTHTHSHTHTPLVHDRSNVIKRNHVNLSVNQTLTITNKYHS